jgi:hypothetical protein
VHDAVDDDQAQRLEQPRGEAVPGERSRSPSMPSTIQTSPSQVERAARLPPGKKSNPAIMIRR